MHFGAGMLQAMCHLKCVLRAHLMRREREGSE